MTRLILPLVALAFAVGASYLIDPTSVLILIGR